MGNSILAPTTRKATLVRTVVLFLVIGVTLFSGGGAGTKPLSGIAAFRGQQEPAPTRPSRAESALKGRAQVREVFDKLPLRFETNVGQVGDRGGERVKFLARGRDYTTYLTARDAVLAFYGEKPEATTQGSKIKREGPQTAALMRIKLLGSNPAPEVSGLNELPGKGNYFIGNNPAQWRTNVTNYSRVKYHNVYRGIDLIYYGNQRRLEYDFVIAPGSDPRAIAISVEGIEAGHPDLHRSFLKYDAVGGVFPIEVDDAGDLVVETQGGEVRFQKPLVYQRDTEQERRASGDEGERHFLAGRYVLKGKNLVGFDVPDYDPNRPLVIDPALSYSTYLSGTSLDQGNAVAVDSSGNAYVTGMTRSVDFPTTSAWQPNCVNCPALSDAFVAKLNAAGSALVYSTYLGGSDSDEGRSIAVDSAGNAYVAGITSSTQTLTTTGFPTTAGAFQSINKGGGDTFVAKLDPAGSLLYSTYLGGNGIDEGLGIAVDGSGKIYVTGDTNSDDFPTTPGAFQTVRPSTGAFTEAFVTKVDPGASGAASLVYSTFLGGRADNDQGNGIAVDASGNAYIAGQTLSEDFPTTPGAFDTTCGSDGHCDAHKFKDGFVTKLNPTGTAPVYSTFLGGADFDEALAIALDSSGNAYVTGLTKSTDLPTTPGVLQPSSAGGFQGFVTKLNPAGSALVYSTYLGGSGFDSGNAIAVDSSGNAYVAGETGSVDFPLASTLRVTCVGCPGFVDAFVAKLNATGTALIFSTYLGGSDSDSANGIALDSSGNAYVTGVTSSTDFQTANAFEAAAKGAGDGFAAKMSGLALPVATISATNLSFTTEIVGTPTPATAMILGNVGDAALNISSVKTSGDFKETNNCGTSVNAGASCTVNITFTPTAGGDRTGTLTISDDAAGSPRVVNLDGTGQDFTLAVGSNSSLSATVTAGQLASYKLGMTSVGGFNQTVSLACTGAPPKGTCSVAPASLTVGGTSASTATVTVTTTPSTTTQAMPGAGSSGFSKLGNRENYGGLWVWLLTLTMVAILRLSRGSSGLSAPSGWQRSPPSLKFCLGVILALLPVGSSSCLNGTKVMPGTPAGT